MAVERERRKRDGRYETGQRDGESRDERARVVRSPRNTMGGGGTEAVAGSVERSYGTSAYTRTAGRVALIDAAVGNRR
ncbi:hypothetical protein WN51_14544 [Melipona quadrifasciata]|uniref:Uncharacterized protein n=1 Tax=Melipona quadrifasciata TaxID=166423 RepID=A0A0N0BGQ5_9HYME|nr:hypothetical protein WN51_14544 [Melipona quadrifasciata]